MKVWIEISDGDNYLRLEVQNAYRFSDIEMRKQIREQFPGYKLISSYYA